MPGNESVMGPADSDVTIFGANPDSSNIGAKPWTIVHTRLIDITAVGAPT